MRRSISPISKPVAFQTKVETEQREVAELRGQQPIVPDGDFAEPVVGDHEGAGLGRAQVIELDRRHLGPAKLAAGEQPAMTGDHLKLGIDQDRRVEAEGRDTLRDLPDLLPAVAPRVGRVRFQLFDPPVDEVEQIAATSRRPLGGTV
jgi:hypothetical protein